MSSPLHSVGFLDCVSLTGIDDYTNLKILDDLYNQHPFIEYGVCFDLPNNNSLRYPGYRIVEKLSSVSHLPLTAHLSEKNTNLLIESFNIDYLKLIPWKRIQLNIDLTKFIKNRTLSKFFDIVTNLREKINFEGQIILPENMITRSIYSTCNIPPFIDMLSDVSKGKGISPTVDNRWAKELYHTRFGFAGGISPYNIKTILKQLMRVCLKCDFVWIDMESSLKNIISHRFDTHKASIIARSSYPFIRFKT